MARVLMLGGTSFVGRAVVEHALARGDHVTLFNRGITNPELFPEAEHVRGDRDGGLGALPDATWDVVVDTSGYLPRVVADSVSALAGRVGWYSFVSSLAVYADLSVPGVTEESPLAPPPDPPSEDAGAHYGALKVLCERAVAGALPDRSTITRCSLIVGPTDPTGRFPYWIDRIVDGGTILAPGDPDTPTQFIDVRDLADWLLGSAESGAAGAYNAAGPAEMVSFGQMLASMAKATGSTPDLVWCDDDFLLSQGMQPFWFPPAWVPASGDLAGLTSVNSSKGMAAGMRFRLLDETVADTCRWLQSEPPRTPVWPRAEETRVLSQRK